ncbi:AraC family transcriptional regulator [Bryobacter aggregatus]|uniref:AraC family transcriptional regulator n=1 Tax=Bryobacter aggregatus TaxID=360054 RepID=UPI0004E10B43|nr:AraC family transcriptional regulator [Bryobacter aggregatus]
MDPLTDIIALLRPHAAFSKPISGRGRWGVRYAAYEQPSFCIVLEGQCWLTLEGDAPLMLERGDYLLLPATPAFTMTSEVGADCTLGNPSMTGVRHGEPDGEPDFRMIGGAFQIDPGNAALLGVVFEKIHIRSAESDTSRLTRVIDLILDEYAAERPGRDMILQRFLEVMLVECLRWQSLHQESTTAGLLAGMRDTPIADALRAMHSDVRHGWTVAELAQHAYMSRSAFATRFTTTIGCAPMEYLARWRMSLAQDALSRGGTSLDRLAEEIGYESASAFSTAFRRRLGCAPGAFARSRRGSSKGRVYAS